jgi:HD superfamily phosphohydrolase
MMDYLPRDSYFTGVEYGKVDVQRVIDSLHVAEGHLVIDDAALYAFEALLLARYEMFKAVYFHRTVRAAELMLVHSMELADDVLGLTDLSDLDKYIDLTDEVVIQKLAALDAATPELREARGLALDFRDRKLVKCVFEKLVQRRERMVGRLFADEKVRRQVTAELAESTKTNPMHIYLDVPTTPSVPETYSKEALTAVRLLRTEGKKRVMKTVPLSDLPLVGSIAGFMDMLRVYTTPENRQAVEIAAAQLFKDQHLASGVSR